MKTNEPNTRPPAVVPAGDAVHTVRNLAAKWNVPVVEVRRAINSGDLGARKVGREFLVTEEAARDFLADHNARGKVPGFEKGDRVAFYRNDELAEGLVLDVDEDGGPLTVEVDGFLLTSTLEVDEEDAQVLTLKRPSN